MTLPLPTGTGLPSGANLTIRAVFTTPDPVVEGNTLSIYVTLENIGLINISAGQQILITVKVDNEQSVVASLIDTLGLRKNQQRTENLTWTATLGATQRRLLIVTVSYLGLDEAVVEKEIRVNERKTDLLFLTTPSIAGMATSGKPLTITAIVKNIGKSTTQPINVSLSVDRSLQQWHLKHTGLLKGESFSVSFSWTPLVFGIYTINLTLDPKNVIAEELKTNNYFETKTSVIPWWNTNWHYRRVFDVVGTGNLSLFMNFTALLASLQVVNKTFENDSITIVQYYSNGTMHPVKAIWFNESSTFHNRTNAVGTLLWTVPTPALYGVYFDVTENRGARNQMSETLTLAPSGSVHATAITTQGWWPEFITDFNTYYPVNAMLSVQIYTTAYAKSIIARFLCNNQPMFNMSCYTLDNLLWTNVTQKLSKIGDWTVHISGSDDAGYQTAPLTAGFYIGKPDLIVSAVSAPSVCYVGNNVTITAHVRAVNTTVKHVNVSFLVNNVVNTTQENLTIQKDENRTLQYLWKPPAKGKYTLSVRVNIDDSNPGNNIKSKNVTVEGIPDMAVLNISVAPVPVDEGNPVAVTARIRNIGDGNATDYEVVLYCEQNENNHTMYYSIERNSTKVNLKKNESRNVTLVWENTRYGKTSFHGVWAVGIQIRTTPQTPDSNRSNNYRSLFHVLRVIPSERNPPILSNLEYPGSQELGNSVLLRVRATDASGIDSVRISIRTASRIFVNATMTPTQNDRYEYVFTPTQLGRHDFVITATDRSPSKNQSTITGSFEITGDRTPPTVSFFGVNPFVQLPYKPVEIRCIAVDLSGIHSALVSIRYPDNRSEEHAMITIPPDTKYVYTSSYETIGKYVLTITVGDLAGNKKTTSEKTFWITNDLNDTDSDGMPDDWERLYGFNPYDPSDAALDADNDGVANLQEYLQGTNPLKKLASSDLVGQLQQNLGYLIGSVVFFACIVFLALYGMRRRNP